MNTPRELHTIVISDLHMTEAEPPHPGNALWKRYKKRKFFVDKSFKRLLDYLQTQIEGPIELVLNGDIFDFDAVMTLPGDRRFKISWLERKRGLNAEEEKSRFKMQVILRDHYIWVQALREFILRGNRAIFVFGNHDLELHWPSVQEEIHASLSLPDDLKQAVRFCEWFYISNNDTLVEHGNQYDDYCMCANPINPTIRKGSRLFVRLPFGNLAGKFIMNAIGLMNPHVESTFIKPSLKEYTLFFFKRLLRVQPFLMWTWFWGSIVTVFYSLQEGFHPPLIDPLTVEARVEDIARRSNTTPRIVRSLRALQVHPAIFNPFKILRELWLDRAFFLGAVFVATFFVFTFLNLFGHVSIGWWLFFFLLVMPFFIFYARTVDPEVEKSAKTFYSKIPMANKITGLKRMVTGHTHREIHTWIEGIEVINTGTWSSAFEDPECTRPYGKKLYAWIRPENGNSQSGRTAELRNWLDPGSEVMPVKKL